MKSGFDIEETADNRMVILSKVDESYSVKILFEARAPGPEEN